MKTNCVARICNDAKTNLGGVGDLQPCESVLRPEPADKIQVPMQPLAEVSLENFQPYFTENDRKCLSLSQQTDTFTVSAHKFFEHILTLF